MASRALTRPNLQRLITPFFNKTQPFSSKPRLPIPTSQQSEYRKLISLANTFQRYGFRPSQLNDFLAKNRFILNYSSFDIENSLKILLSFRLSQHYLVSMVERCPRLLQLEFLKKWETSFSQTGMSNFTSSMIQNVLEVSRKFSLGPDDLSTCIHRFKGLGFSESTVIRVLEEAPMVILTSESGICERIEFLVGIGIDKNDIDWIFRKFPCIMIYGVDNRLNPLLEEFKYLGFSKNEVKNEILRDPRVLGFDLGEFSHCLQMLNKLKCREPIKEKIYCDGAFRAAYAVKLRVDYLCHHGLTYREAFSVLWKEPRTILYEIKEIERKIEYLVTTMKFDIRWLVDVPEYLGINFEKQIVPRHNVIEYLRSKGGLGYEVGLKALIKPSRLKFYNLYVKPYPECEQIYGRFTRDGEVKSRHPVGMWKLFKPKNQPDTREDIKNIKSFMETLVN